MRIRRIPVLASLQLLAGGALSFIGAVAIYLLALQGPTSLEEIAILTTIMWGVLCFSLGVLGVGCALFACAHLAWAFFAELVKHPEVAEAVRSGRIR